MALPMLPGYSFPDPSKQDFKKTQAFGFKNGQVVNKDLNKSLETTYDYTEFERELPPITLTGPAMQRSIKPEVKLDPYVPPNVKYYKQVLKFDGYWKEQIGRDKHDRGAVIHYFLEDDTIQVSEPKLPNSGIQQGILLRRQRIPLDQSLAQTAPFQTTLNSNTDAFSRTSPTPTRSSIHVENTLTQGAKGGVRDPNNYLGALNSTTNSPPQSRGSPTFTRASSPNFTRITSPGGSARSGSPTSNIYNTTTFNSTAGNKSGGEFFSWQDLGVGIKVMFYGREYYITDADKFTRDFYRDEGIDLPPAEPLPEVLDATPVPPNTRLLSHDTRTPEERYRLRKFLDNDRKVLRFYCIWDDRSSGRVERRPFILNYFLVDDSVEVREVFPPNSGRDPASTFMRKQRLPKKPTALSDMKTADFYTDADLSVGMTINVFGRNFLIYDADAFTREYYEAQYGITEFPHVQVEEQARAIVTREIPEYTGFGSEEDSLANCLSLIPKPPKKIVKSTVHAASDVMRFTAQLEGHRKGEEDRKFVVSFHIEDDTFSIYENAIRGNPGGKFMERKKLKNPKTNTYYCPYDFFVGALLDINAHKFRLIDGDGFACNYFEEHQDEFAEAAKARTVDDVRVAASTLKPGMLRRALATTPSPSPSTFRQSLNKAGLNLDDNTISTLCSLFQTSPASSNVDTSLFLRSMGC